MIADFRLKACPRCRGDMGQFEDPHGKYWSCMQCGYHEHGAVRKPAPKPSCPRLPIGRWEEA